MKKTAIEWLESKLYEFETIQYSLPTGLYEYLEQAKEMEKQQIISGYAFGHNDGCRYMTNEKQEFEHAEQYYNDTYNLS